MTSTYLGYRLYANNYDKTLTRVAAEPANAREQAYYTANIGKVTSVDQFVNDYRPFNYAMKAFNLQDLGNAKGLMKKVLESDLSSSSSFVNKLTDPRFQQFAQAFQFTSKGAVASTSTAQTTTQTANTTALFVKTSTASAAVQTAATTYFTAQIGSVSGVADLEGNAKLLAYVESAYGIDPKTSTANLTAALESDTSDAKSFANTTSIKGLKALVADFNFGSDGKIAPQRQLQSTADIKATTKAYASAVGTSAAATDETTYYETTMPTLTSVDAFLSDKRLLAYAETARGVSSTTTTAQLKAILSSDLTSSKSYANTNGSADKAFAAAFDVDTQGTIARAPAVEAQSKSGVATVTSAYLEQAVETEAAQSSAGVKLALYFRNAAPKITSGYQILADKALTQFVRTAFGLASSSSKADIDSQARSIDKELNYADLKNPAKLDKLIARFAALYDLTNSSTSSSNSSSSSTSLTL